MRCPATARRRPRTWMQSRAPTRATRTATTCSAGSRTSTGRWLRRPSRSASLTRCTRTRPRSTTAGDWRCWPKTRGRTRRHGSGLPLRRLGVRDESPARQHIYTANGTDDSFLSMNRGKAGELAREGVGMRAGVARDRGVANGRTGFDAGDFDRTGRPSLFVTNDENELPALYRNQSSGANPVLTYYTLGSDVGRSAAATSVGARASSTTTSTGGRMYSSSAATPSASRPRSTAARSRCCSATRRGCARPPRRSAGPTS